MRPLTQMLLFVDAQELPQAEEIPSPPSPPRCGICQHLLGDAEGDLCRTCVHADRLGEVSLASGGRTARFVLYSYLDSAGRRVYLGAAQGDELGNWTETDAPVYWPQDDDIEKAVQRQLDLYLILKDWFIAPDGSRVTLDFVVPRPAAVARKRKPVKQWKAG